MQNNKGFTLVELVVVMGIFMIIMLITSYTFDNILSKAGQQIKSAETQTEGIVGLEMLRSDLEHIGYGLPWSYPAALAPVEVTATANPADGITSSGLNDSPPRAIRSTTIPAGKMIINNSGNTNTGVAYLVIKSTLATLSPAARKWAYVNYSTNLATGSNESYVKKWGTPADDFSGGERVITIASSFSTTGVPSKQLVMDAGGNYSYPMPSPVPTVFQPGSSFIPGDGSQLYVVYGIDPATDLRMPYNRADYYVRNDATRPLSCNPGTGILYKGVVQHATGAFAEYPLLNCVGDMQVEFELDRNNDGNITYSPSLTDASGNELSPADIRSQLKNVRVYILAHEGKKDQNYTYNKNSIQVGDPARPASSGRTWDGTPACTSNCLQTVFGADWKNYRWKVYTIVVHPKNLN
jgi:prepilin-type N-terminal cleavage/methylation domain-containing protein